MGDEAIYMRKCPAMVKEGITDPTSQEGINFCTEKCPYEKCVVLEPNQGDDARHTAAAARRKARKKRARELDAEGLYPEDIAKELNVNVRTVRGYLK